MAAWNDAPRGTHTHTHARTHARTCLGGGGDTAAPSTNHAALVKALILGELAGTKLAPNTRMFLLQVLLKGGVGVFLFSFLTHGYVLI